MDVWVCMSVHWKETNGDKSKGGRRKRTKRGVRDRNTYGTCTKFDNDIVLKIGRLMILPRKYPICTVQCTENSNTQAQTHRSTNDLIRISSVLMRIYVRYIFTRAGHILLWNETIEAKILEKLILIWKLKKLIFYTKLPNILLNLHSTFFLFT